MVWYELLSIINAKKNKAKNVGLNLIFHSFSFLKMLLISYIYASDYTLSIRYETSGCQYIKHNI
jgi:hypothetical protein